MKDSTAYSPREEAANVITHGVGAILAIPTTFLLVGRASAFGGLAVLGYALFGLSLFLLLLASTLYHQAKGTDRRKRLRVFDHASIYVLIAGTYSAFCLTALVGTLGWAIFGLIWFLALAGIVYSLFFTGRFKLLMVGGYVAMGWIIVFAFGPLSRVLPGSALVWLVAGGLSYTLGSVLYSLKKIPWSHPIWHLFVLGGAACHVVSALVALG
jgi:hemolysin III